MGGEYAHIKTGINGTCAFTNGKVPVMNGKMSALAAMIYKPAQNSDKELNNNELGQEKEGEKVAENGSEVGNGLCDERLTGLIFSFSTTTDCKENAVTILGKERFETLKDILYTLHLKNYHLDYSFRIMEFSKDGSQLT